MSSPPSDPDPVPSEATAAAATAAAATRELLGPAGPVARRLECFEDRPEQLSLAAAVAAGLATGRHLLAEAGTGVGKSFAYLVPAVLHATQHRGQGPVVVSTRTIGLQQQLEEKDIPFLQAVLPQEFSAVTAVGRNNYLCLRRLGLARQERGLLFSDPARQAQLEAVAEWSVTTTSGLRMGLPAPVDHEVWDEVKAEHGNCLHKACPFFDPCHYQASRRRMGTADLLIVNHSLYMADVALRMAGAAYLPTHRAVIFDEAHHLERVATESLGLRISQGVVEWHARRLHPRNARRSLLGRYGSDTSRTLLSHLRLAAEDFFGDLQFRLDAPASGRRQDTLALTDETLDSAAADLADELADSVDGDAMSIEEVSLRMEMHARARGLRGLSITLRALCAPQRPDLVRWAERGRRSPELRAAPLDVSAALGELVFGGDRSAVLVSATLGTGDQDYSWLRQKLGIGDATTLRLGSPFRYDRQVELVLEPGMPDPATRPQDFDRESKHRIRDHLLDNGGRALVLCTSWRFLQELASFLRPLLEWQGIELLVQGEAPIPRLLARKLEVPTSVLIGTDSLWEGIDVPGEALTLVIITRFPFASPGHPLTEARTRAIEQRGGSGFRDHSLPEAILKFRQGFGRLVRSSHDHGRVVVLDPRVQTKGYGRAFLAGLPPELRRGED